MYLSPVTQKGQITIPQLLRLQYGVEPYGKVRLEPGKGHIKVIPTEDILDLAGKWKAPKGKNALKAREEMAKNYKRF